MRPKPRRILPAVLALVGLFAFTTLGHAQSVTTGAAAGTITDQNGAPLANASVVLTYEATGFRVSGITNERGAFNLQGLQPGIYSAQISLIGYRTETRGNIAISLGQSSRLSASLEQTAVELEALVVQADQMSAEFSPTNTGTSTTINEQQVRDLPNLDRRFSDLARLTPQIVATDANAGAGLSVVGQNNRYNTIQIDGSTVNDRFGLGATGTAGGQAAGKPIGAGAVKEFQVMLAPYDVRQGNFTGALLNAITKSGSNQWFGDAFGQFRNQDMAGKPLSESEFKNFQYGGSIGGPIARDKAFFFANAEFQQASTPATGPYIGAPSSTSGIRPAQTDIDAMNAVLGSYGMAAGSGAAVTNDNPLTNLTLRADWSLGDNNRLVFRYSYNTAELGVFSRTTSTSNPAFRYENNGYDFTNKTHNPSLQLFTNFSNGNANEFRISYNRIRDARDPREEAPQVTVDGFTNGSGEDYQILTGAEQFSQGNRLDQDILEFTDNFTFAPKGDHTFTVGTRNEFYSLYEPVRPVVVRRVYLREPGRLPVWRERRRLGVHRQRPADGRPGAAGRVQQRPVRPVRAGPVAGLTLVRADDRPPGGHPRVLRPADLRSAGQHGLRRPRRSVRPAPVEPAGRVQLGHQLRADAAAAWRHRDVHR